MAQTEIHSDDADLFGELSRPHVLAVGRWDQREFAEAIAKIPAAQEWSAFSTLDQACDQLVDCDRPPEVILLAQPLPGQYCDADIDHLQQLVPLTRIVIVAGTWCEGELRTGTPPAGTIRLYWYELAPWWQAALRRRDANRCPLWSLPLDHLQSGRCSMEFDEPLASSAGLSVLIDTADFAAFESLSAALGIFEMTCYRAQAVHAASSTAGIWDGGQLSKQELQRLENFCQRIPGPNIALLDFPRVEHIQLAKAAGATAVFAKPYIVEELVAALGCHHAPT